MYLCIYLFNDIFFEGGIPKYFFSSLSITPLMHVPTWRYITDKKDTNKM